MLALKRDFPFLMSSVMVTLRGEDQQMCKVQPLTGSYVVTTQLQLQWVDSEPEPEPLSELHMSCWPGGH